MKTLIRALLALVFLAGNVAVVEAETMCATRQAMLEALTGKYQEHRAGMGASGRTGIAELYVSEHGSWTLIMNTSPTWSCIIAAGHRWRTVETPVAGEDS